MHVRTLTLLSSNKMKGAWCSIFSKGIRLFTTPTANFSNSRRGGERRTRGNEYLKAFTVFGITGIFLATIALCMRQGFTTV